MFPPLRLLLRTGRRSPSRRRAPTVRPSVERCEDRVVPSASPVPTGLTATGASPTAISLTWNASPDPSVTGYDVYEKITHVVHSPKGSSSATYTYSLIASSLTTPADVVSGVAAGSAHTYVVTAVNASGQSAYSAAVTGQTWVAPSLASGPSTVLLSSGALWSGAVNATAGQTTQFSLLVGGNPLAFSIASGPRTLSIDPHTGVVTYTPAPGEVGSTSATFRVSNPLGTVTQTVALHVAAPSALPAPKLSLNATTGVYTGQAQSIGASGVGTNGAYVSGTYAVAFNGGRSGPPVNVGTYQVLVTFTSSDPHYGNATLLTTYTVTPATPAFASLSSPTVAAGPGSVTLTGHIAAGWTYPTGDSVIVTLNGVSQAAMVDATGNFATTFNTGALAQGQYTIRYSFAGDASFKAAAPATSTLNVVAPAAPVVTLNPTSVTVSPGDPAGFTAAATGIPSPTVQWQVSTDGGKTWANVTSNTSATTTSLVVQATLAMNGYRYRAVFTNSAGTAISSAATLTVEPDTGN